MKRYILCMLSMLSMLSAIIEPIYMVLAMIC